MAETRRLRAPDPAGSARQGSGQLGRGQAPRTPRRGGAAAEPGEAPTDELGLVAAAREQSRKATAGENGRAARTVYGGHDLQLRQTVISLSAGTSLAEHENPGEATVPVLSGRVRLGWQRASWEGRSGDLIVVPQERHTLVAVEDSSVLLTVVKHR